MRLRSWAGLQARQRLGAADEGPCLRLSRVRDTSAEVLYMSADAEGGGYTFGIGISAGCACRGGESVM